MARVVQLPDRFISGESGALVRASTASGPSRPGRKVLASDFGVDDLPTLLSNASTFAQLAVLACSDRSVSPRSARMDEPGTILLSVGGSAAHPGRGRGAGRPVPLAAVLDICQAPAGDGVLVGGYHGMWLSAETAYAVPVSREGLAAWAAPSAPASCCPSATGPARWARSRGSRATWPASRPGSAVRASSACPPSPGALAALVDGSGGIEALDVASRSAAG
jgi:hypothetical protein